MQCLQTLSLAKRLVKVLAVRDYYQRCLHFIAVKPHPLHSAFLYSQTKNSVDELSTGVFVHFIRVISHIFRNQSVKCEI